MKAQKLILLSFIIILSSCFKAPKGSKPVYGLHQENSSAITINKNNEAIKPITDKLEEKIEDPINDADEEALLDDEEPIEEVKTKPLKKELKKDPKKDIKPKDTDKSTKMLDKQKEANVEDDEPEIKPDKGWSIFGRPKKKLKSGAIYRIIGEKKAGLKKD